MEQEEEKRGMPGRMKSKLKESWPKMLKSLQNSNLGYGFQLSSTDLYLHSRMETQIMKNLRLKREQDQIGIQNPELRSLCIAAFLRCLFASIESAPGTIKKDIDHQSAEGATEGKYYEMAVDNIKSDKIFGQIT